MAKIQLIVRADDLGYSEAVNCGIAISVWEGIVGSVGLMPNMPAAAHGLKLLEGADVCIGQHTNICLGKPCADPKLIPSLLGPNGQFKSSKTYWEAWSRGEETTVLEEVILEIEAQYARFKELTGREPGYFECHAVANNNLAQGLQIVAQRHGLKFLPMNPQGEITFNGKPVTFCPMNSMKPDYDPWESLKEGVRLATPGVVSTFVGHPGYLDDYLLTHSSLTVNRAKEVTMFCDPAVRAWLEEQGVELITYDDV